MSQEITPNAVPVEPPPEPPPWEPLPPPSSWPEFDESKKPDVINGWRYDPDFPEIDNILTPDNETSGRFSFERKMYFEPYAYNNWSKGKNYDGHSYLANLVGNPYLPLEGQPLSATSYFPDKTGPIGSFYMREMKSIENLTAENSEATSYAVVTYEYENMDNVNHPKKTLRRPDYPWKEEVKDFQITNYEESVPFISGYLGGEYKPVATTAGQPILGQTTSQWCQRLTWTIYTKPDKNYRLNRPVINAKTEKLFEKITIDPGEGLLLPPAYKMMVYTDKWGRETEYSEWSYEVLINPKGFKVELANAGTKGHSVNYSSQRSVDLYYWTFTSRDYPKGAYGYGSFSDMEIWRRKVLQDNQSNGFQDRYRFNGGPVKADNPLPLDKYGNVDGAGLQNPSKRLYLQFERYKRADWDFDDRIRHPKYGGADYGKI